MIVNTYPGATYILDGAKALLRHNQHPEYVRALIESTTRLVWQTDHDGDLVHGVVEDKGCAEVADLLGVAWPLGDGPTVIPTQDEPPATHTYGISQRMDGESFVIFEFREDAEALARILSDPVRWVRLSEPEYRSDMERPGWRRVSYFTPYHVAQEDLED